MEINKEKMIKDFNDFYEYYCRNLRLTKGKNAILPNRELAFVFYSKGRTERDAEAYKQGVSDLLKYQEKEGK